MHNDAVAFATGYGTDDSDPCRELLPICSAQGMVTIWATGKGCWCDCNAAEFRDCIDSHRTYDPMECKCVGEPHPEYPIDPDDPCSAWNAARVCQNHGRCVAVNGRPRCDCSGVKPCPAGMTMAADCHCMPPKDPVVPDPPYTDPNWKDKPPYTSGDDDCLKEMVYSCGALGMIAVWEKDKGCRCDCAGIDPIACRDSGGYIEPATCECVPRKY